MSFAEVTEEDGNYQCAFMATAMLGETTARLKAGENQEAADVPWTLVYLLVWTRAKAFTKRTIPGAYMRDEEWKDHFIRLMNNYVDAIKQYGLEEYEGDLGYVPVGVVHGPAEP